MPKSSKVSFRDSFHQEYRRQKSAVSRRLNAYLNRRPHRSFQRTRRRDYVRSLQLPGYWRFTNEVTRTVWRYRKIFLWLGAVYAVLWIVLIGFGSQDSYNELVQTLKQTGAEGLEGQWSKLGEAALLFATIASSGIVATLTDAQQIYSVILGLMVWLTTIWLLRQLSAGRVVKMRDGLYNAGAPLVPMFILTLALVIQLLPLALAIIGYNAASATGLLNNGVEAMLFWAAALLAVTLSLYWVMSTFFAMVMITLPGTYPWQALRTAGDMVVGRRLRLLYRLGWAFLALAVTWAIVLIPTILIDSWLKGMWSAISWVPLVPAVLLALTVISLIWSTAYIYLLYRKVIDDDAAPS